MSMLENAIKALGIDPVQLQQAIGQVIADAAHVKAQVDGAKAGFQAGATFFKARIEAVETRTRCIELMLQELLTAEQLGRVNAAVQIASEPAPLVALPNGTAPNDPDRREHASGS